MVARHARLRGRGRRGLPAERRVGGTRGVPRAGPRGDRMPERHRRDRGALWAGPAHRSADRSPCARADPRGAHLRAPGAAVRRRHRGARAGGDAVKVTILGLSITSSWGNGHATNYRALARALSSRGDEVTFLERERSWYSRYRDLPAPRWCKTILYDSLSELEARFAAPVADGDLVIVGSFVPDGVAVCEWVLAHARGAVAFYDIDTPVTLAKLRAGDSEYLSAELVGRFDLYLSFTAGPALEILRGEFGA